MSITVYRVISLEDGRRGIWMWRRISNALYVWCQVGCHKDWKRSNAGVSFIGKFLSTGKVINAH